MSFAWQCPFCGHHSTIGSENFTSSRSRFHDGNKYGPRMVTWAAITCPNEECGEYSFSVAIYEAIDKAPAGSHVLGPQQHSWQLVPAAKMKVLPSYVPSPIVADYKEACLIAELSPKASATLSRRCLQGMIRDFWGVSKARLVDEIEAIKDKVDNLAWEAIDGVRKIGNIGAHMERDINVIVDVDPNEAQLLIGLIETLIDDWYVVRHQRQERLTKIVAAANAKKPGAQPTATGPSTP